MAEITKCDSRTVLNLENRLRQIYKVIDAHRWIIEAYVSDFYVKDHWSRLPQSWQEFLEEVDFSALSCLLTGQPWCSVTTGGRVSPLSLLALKAFVQQRALNRQCVDLDHAGVSSAVSHTLMYKEDVVRASADVTAADPLPPDAVMAADPLPPDAVTAADPVSPDAVTAADPLPPDAVTAADPLPPDAVTAADPLPPDAVTAADPLPLDAVTAADPLPPDAVTAADPLPPDAVTAADPLPPDAVTAADPLPPDAVTAADPLPPDAVTAADPVPPDAACSGGRRDNTRCPLGFRNGQLMDMEHIFRKHVKPKKQHEIRQLGKVVQLVTRASGSDHVVDVGAGLGHLSRLLTFAHGLKVTTVEAAGGHAPKASEFDRELKKDIQKKQKRREPGSDQQETTTTTTYATPADLPNHVVCRVEPDISTEDFLALVLRKDRGSASSGGETAGSPSSGDATPRTVLRSGGDATPRTVLKSGGDATPRTVLKSGGDEPMAVECEHSAQTQTASDVGVKAAPSLSCSEQSVTTSSTDEVPSSECVRLRGASSLVRSEETVAKISRYDAELHTCLKCGGGGGEEGPHANQSFSEFVRNTAKDQSENSSQAHTEKSTQNDSLVSMETAVHETNKESLVVQNVKVHSRRNEQNSKEAQSAGNEREEPSCSTESVCDRCERTAPHAQRAGRSVCGKRDPQPASEAHVDRKACAECNEPHVERKVRRVCGEERDRSVHARSSSSVSRSGSGDGGEEGEGGGRRRGMVLAGLHACGDLTATLLRVFVNCPAVSALVSVGCCYMKLSPHSDDDLQCERGYPMSQFVRSLPSHPLTYEAREMACHFADAYAQRLLDNPPHLKIHSYRAALQYVVTRSRPDFVPGATRLIVKKGAEIPFPQYASRGLRRLGMDVCEVPEDVMARAEAMTAHWRRVVAFYTLRLSLAPLVETALLLDRMLFLYEHGIPSVAVPVFDSALSPRNFALLACKPQTL